MKSFYDYIHTEETIEERVDTQINGMRKLSTDNAEKVICLASVSLHQNGNQWLVELIPLIKRYNVSFKLGKNNLENRNTLDFFKLTGHYELHSLVPTRLAGKISECIFFLWEMEEEKGSSGRQMKYFIFKKEEKESQEIMRWV